MELALIPVAIPDDAPAEFEVSADLYDTQRVSLAQFREAQECWKLLKAEGVRRGYVVHEWHDDLTLVQTLSFRRAV